MADLWLMFPSFPKLYVILQHLRIKSNPSSLRSDILFYGIVDIRWKDNTNIISFVNINPCMDKDWKEEGWDVWGF